MKKGRQTPTLSVVLPYKETLGDKAIELYEKTNRVAQEWQKLLIYDMLATNEDDLWTHTKFGYSLPRRNGKNEVVAIRELWGLVNGQQILHTAHRTTTSHTAWERLVMLITNAGYAEGEDFKTHKQFGLERIEMADGGRINFRTRSTKGGLGEGFDLLVIDEAQEYQDDQESALKYVVTDSMNPQTVYCGTPPTAVSSGTVFTRLRESTLLGESKNTAWEEWSVSKKTDPNDKDAWYLTNPSLGTIFSVRSVEDEVGTDDLDFNIQRLGYWVRYNQKSAISKVEWQDLKMEEKPTLTSKLYVGIKYSHDSNMVSVAVGVKTADDRVFLEVIRCKPIRAGTFWIIDFLSKADIEEVVIDGANGQELLKKEMKKHRLLKPILPTVKQVIVAHSEFEQGLYSQKIMHNDQPSLTQVITNCEKRPIGSNGGFGYRPIKDDMESSLIDSIVLAYWASVNSKEKRKQKISY